MGTRAGIPAPVDGEQYLSMVTIAGRWGVSVRQIESLRYRDKLPPAIRIGRQLRWRLADIEAYEAENTETAAG